MRIIKTYENAIREALTAKLTPQKSKWHGPAYNKDRKQQNLNYLLNKAILTDSFDVCKVLIELGANPNSNGSQGSSNLQIHDAAGFSSPEIIALLLDNGADVNKKGTAGRTPLHCAAMDSIGNDNINLLLDRGAKIEAKDSKGNTALQMSCIKTDEEQIKNLVEKGANVNSKNYQGQTPLITLIIEGGASDMVVFLLDHGADPLLFDKNKEAALHHLCNVYFKNDEEFEEAVNLMLSYSGGDIDQSFDGGPTPLRSCITNPYWRRDQAMALLNMGADWLAAFKTYENLLRFFDNDLSWWKNPPKSFAAIEKTRGLFKR